MSIATEMHDRVEQQTSERPPRWFEIIAFAQPQTLQGLLTGFELELAANVTREIPPAEKAIYWRRVRQTKQKRKGTPGYHNPVKIQVTPAEPDIERPNVFRYTAKPAMFVESLALGNQADVPNSLKEEVNHGGVAALIITADNKILFEERSDITPINPGVGGPIGGSLDGTLIRNSASEKREPIIADASPEHILNQVRLEIHEELGIPEDKLTFLCTPGAMRVAGVVQDKKRGHFDIVYVVYSPFTQKQHQKMYTTHKQNGNDHLHDPMPKHLVAIDATPEAIQKMLGDSDVINAPITQGTFTLGGYMLFMEQRFRKHGNLQKAVEEAKEWKETTEEKTARNNERINRIAREENERASDERIDPIREELRDDMFRILQLPAEELIEEAGKVIAKIDHILEELPEEGYDSRFLPKEQGFPSLRQAIKEAGLLTRKKPLWRGWFKRRLT